MNNMEDLIKEKLIAYHKRCNVDKWGQVGTFSLSLFGEQMNDVENFAKATGSLIDIKTYGGRFGTYKGFQIIDSDLRKDCSLALKQNPQYIYSMTH